MNFLFIIEHSIDKESDGSIKINLFRVNLIRKSKKTYSIHHFKDEGWIKISADKEISHNVKDLFTLRYLNLLYLEQQTVQVTLELIQMLLQSAQNVNREEE